MSSIGNSAASQAGASPFAIDKTVPRPGGLRTARTQAMNQETAQAGLSSRARSASPLTASAPTGSGGADTNADAAGGLITANDFLSLLVTEMQNQDPTADTDPNEYINQLVQINSLEQLISINQNLVEVLGTATSPATPPSSVTGHHSAKSTGQAHTEVSSSGALPGATSAGTTGKMTGGGLGRALKGGNGSSGAAGNLSMPKVSPASRKVAHALDGRIRGLGRGHGVRDIPTRP